jgi:hypothetical protein
MGTLFDKSCRTKEVLIKASVKGYPDTQALHQDSLDTVKIWLLTDIMLSLQDIVLPLET